MQGCDDKRVRVKRKRQQGRRRSEDAAGEWGWSEVKERDAYLAKMELRISLTASCDF